MVASSNELSTATVTFQMRGSPSKLLKVAAPSFFILGLKMAYRFNARATSKPPKKRIGVKTQLRIARRKGSEKKSPSGSNSSPVPNPYFKTAAVTKYKGIRLKIRPSPASFFGEVRSKNVLMNLPPLASL